MHSSPQRQSYQLLVNFKNCQMASNLTQGWPRNAKQRAINCFVSTSAARQKAATTDDSTSKRDNQMVGGERGKKCTTSTHTHTHAHIHTLQCYTDVCYFAVNIYWWWWWLCGEEVKSRRRRRRLLPLGLVVRSCAVAIGNKTCLWLQPFKWWGPDYYNNYNNSNNNWNIYMCLHVCLCVRVCDCKLKRAGGVDSMQDICDIL